MYWVVSNVKQYNKTHNKYNYYTIFHMHGRISSKGKCTLSRLQKTPRLGDPSPTLNLENGESGWCSIYSKQTSHKQVLQPYLINTQIKCEMCMQITI